MRNIIFLSVALPGLYLVLAGCGGGGGTSGVLANTPSITSISPTSSAPGSVITIYGTNLTATYTIVSFSGPTSASATAGSGSSALITVTIPSQLIAGAYNVTVTGSDANGDLSTESNAVQIGLL